MSEQSDRLLSKLRQAAAVLERQISAEPDETHTMASIQAFEFTYELAWKWLRTELEARGVEATSPRDVFRLAGQNKLIESVELWIEFMQQRNTTSHTYQENTAKEVYKLVKEKFAPEIQRLLSTN